MNGKERSDAETGGTRRRTDKGEGREGKGMEWEWAVYLILINFL
jgi:hypothetical protein